MEQYYLGDNDHEPDSMSFSNNLPAKEAGLKTEEKLEEILKPGVTSLTLTLLVGNTKKTPGAKQKAKVIQLLQEYVHPNLSATQFLSFYHY